MVGHVQLLAGRYVDPIVLTVRMCLQPACQRRISARFLSLCRDNQRFHTRKCVVSELLPKSTGEGRLPVVRAPGAPPFRSLARGQRQASLLARRAMAAMVPASQMTRRHSGKWPRTCRSGYCIAGRREPVKVTRLEAALSLRHRQCAVALVAHGHASGMAVAIVVVPGRRRSQYHTARWLASPCAAADEGRRAGGWSHIDIL